ncbi:MAG: RIP metalloprotease RseP [Dehalobacterium sp.]|jgi:regulator of sigma E protease
MSILWSIIILGVLILVHEFGHFITAKKNDVQVDEFSLGMGPKLFDIEKGSTIYTLRLLPIGGYVRMAGMDETEQEGGERSLTGCDDPRGFNNKTVLQRMSIIFSGPVMNFVTAILFFIIAYMGVGIPSNDNVLGQVMPDQPAARAGMEPGDRVVNINGAEISTWDEMVQIIHQSPNQELTITVHRDEQIKIFQVVPELDQENNIGLIGVTTSMDKKGFMEAASLGVTQTYEFTKLLILAIVQMITGAIQPDLAGPVGIVSMVGEVSRLGIGSVLTFAGVLSINLGLINLFPIPALDGSRLIFLALEGLRGRPLAPEKENFIHFIGFVLLMGLMLMVTYKDIQRLFQ